MSKENTQNTQNKNTQNTVYNFKDVCKLEGDKIYYRVITADPKKPEEDVVIDKYAATHVENKVDKAFNVQFVDNANKKIDACVEELNDIENYVDVVEKDKHDIIQTVTLKKKNSVSNFTGRNLTRIALLTVITKLLNGDALTTDDEKVLNNLTTIERGTPFVIYKGMTLAELLQKNANAKKSFSDIQEIAKSKGLTINMATMMVE